MKPNSINPLDIEISTYRTGSAWFPRDSGVKITHLPTGITTSCDTERSQHANRAKAYDQLSEIIEGVTRAIKMQTLKTKPQLDITHDELLWLINDALLAATTKQCQEWKDWPGTQHFAHAVRQALLGVLDVSKPKIKRGSRVRVVGGFSLGSFGTVDFVEPNDGKIWMTRDGDSSPKWWKKHELEILV